MPDDSGLEKPCEQNSGHLHQSKLFDPLSQILIPIPILLQQTGGNSHPNPVATNLFVRYCVYKGKKTTLRFHNSYHKLPHVWQFH